MTCFYPEFMFLPREHPIYKFAEHFEKYYRRTIFKHHYKYYPVEKPCLTCIGCRLDHASDWAVRIYCEMKTAKIGCFVTLTYAPQNAPLTELGQMTLKIEDTQKFWHDLRQKNPKKDIRYVIAGEYGTKSTKRPHYHACIFGYEPTDLKFYKYSKADKTLKLYKSKELTKLWGKGIVIIGRLEYRSACYVARYVQKKAGIKKQKKIYEEMIIENEKAPTMNECKQYAKYLLKEKKSRRCDEKIINRTAKILFQKTRTRWKRTELKDPNKPKEEFILSSLRPAIGLQYWNENKDKIKRNSGIFVQFDNKVKLKPIPTYFKKKWKEENPEEYYIWAYKQQKNADKILRQKISQLKLPDWWSYQQKLKHVRNKEEQALLHSIKKSNLAERNNFI